MNRTATREYGLSKHADLKTRPEGEILVLPEQAIRVGGSGGEILRLVIEDGNEESIIEAMQLRYPEARELQSEVRRFLEDMVENGGLTRIETKNSSDQAR